jgi:hypothetical protein
MATAERKVTLRDLELTLPPIIRGFYSSPRELLVYSSVIIFIALWLSYWLAYDTFWMRDFIYFVKTLVAVMFVVAVIGLILFAREFTSIAKRELKGGTILVIGVLSLGMIGVLWAVTPPGFRTSSFPPIEYSSLILLGLSICIIGAVVLARDGGYFTAWLLGVLTIIAVGLLELIVEFHIIRPQVDRYYIFVSRFIILLGLFLCLYGDAKYYFLIKLTTRGNELRRQGLYEKALKCHNWTIKIYPYYVTGWNNKGNTLYNLKRYEEALEAYTRALEIDPNYESARRNMEILLRRTQIEVDVE